MKVILVCGSYPPKVCGVADYTIALARALVAQGVDTEIWTSVGMDEQAVPKVSARAVFLGWGVKDVRGLLPQISIAQPDIVHIQFPAEIYHGAFGVHVLPLLLNRMKIPVITTLHEYCRAPRGGRAKQILNILFSRSVIVTNEQDELLVGRWGGGKVRRIPIGSNIPVLSSPDGSTPILEICGIEPNAQFFLFFGFARQGKGIETLLEAFSRVRSSEINMLFAGQPPEQEYRNEMDSLCKDLNIQDRVKWAGYQPPELVSLLFSACKAAVLPFEDGATERRGSLLAAIAHQVPVVTTRGPFTPEMFRDGINMSIAESLKAEELAENMQMILDDPGYADNLRQGAKALAAEFDWNNIAAANLEVYRETLEAGNPV